MENNSAPIFETGEVVKENVFGSCKRCGKSIPYGTDYCDDCLKEINEEKKKAKSKSRLTMIIAGVSVVVVALVVVFVIISRGKNVWKEDSNGIFHYYDAAGKLAKDELIKDGNNTYYVDKDGAKVIGNWAEIGDKTYYFDKEDGKMAVDTVITDGDDTYCFDKDGNKVVDDWAEIGDKFYYLDKDGHAIKDKWETIKGMWYVFDKDGVLQTNTWTLGDNGLKYYLGPDGHMLVNTLYDIDGVTYYFDAAGLLKMNELVMANGGVYYAGIDGSIEKNKWVFNNTYYAGEDGKILVNTTTPDGVQVDSLGRRKAVGSGNLGGGTKTPEETTKKDSGDNKKKEDTTLETTKSVDTSKGIWIESYSSFSDSYAFDGETYVDIVIKCPVFGAENSGEASNMNSALNSCRDDMINLACEKIDEEESPKNYKINSASIANLDSNKVTIIMKGKLERSGKAARDVVVRFIYDRTDGTGFVKE